MPAVREHEAQLAWERRFAPFAVAAALGAIVLTIGAQAVAAPSLGARDSQREQLLNLQAHPDAALAAAIIQSLSFFLVAAVVLYLLRCVRYRRPEGIPSIVEPLVLIAPIVIAVAVILGQLNVSDLADKFVASGARTENRAEALFDGQSMTPLLINIAGHIALGFGFILASLNSMRVGLMTRFMSILGIAIGALNALPGIFPGAGIIEIFWLGAAAMIFLGRWPGGRGEAWEDNPEGWPEGRSASWSWRSDADGNATGGPASRPVPQWTRPGATPVETLGRHGHHH